MENNKSFKIIRFLFTVKYRKTSIDEAITAKNHELVRIKTNDHPLKTVTVSERIPRRVLGSQSSTGRTTPISTPSMILEPLSVALEGVDPLTAFAIEEMDPLSRIAADEVSYKLLLKF